MNRSEIEVFFSLSREVVKSDAFASSKINVILIPSDDNWNDFGWRVKFNCIIAGGPLSTTFEIGILLALTDSDKESKLDPRSRIADYLSSTGKALAIADQFPRFFSLLPNLQSYRQIVSVFGTDKALAILTRLNDLVSAKESSTQSWLKDALSSKVFRYAFVRNSESYFAFMKAGSILQGLDHEDKLAISTNFRLKFNSATTSLPIDLKFTFDPQKFPSQRIAIVIGKNGVGKSQALSQFARALTSKRKNKIDSNGQKPLVNRLIAVSTPGETKATFPKVRKSSIEYTRLILGNTSRKTRASTIGTVLVSLLRSHEFINNASRWNFFLTVLSDIVPVAEIAIRMADSDGKLIGDPVLLTKIDKGSEQEKLDRWNGVANGHTLYRLHAGKLVRMSSGQITFIHFLAQMSLHIETGSMILIDEPETHLHPNYIEGFVEILNSLLNETGSLAILATHSPYFVREVTRQQVIVLRHDQEGRLESLRPRLRTFGADVGTISHFIFEDSSFGATVDAICKKLPQQRDERTAFLEQIKGELAPEAYMNLMRGNEE